MIGGSTRERLGAALTRFRTFFEELELHFAERSDVLAQASMALLGREHLLITGPPGTAKSSLATAVLSRIVDERTGGPSVFSRQITESTVQTDLVGPLDFKTLTETGRSEHFTDEGILGAVHAHLDEILDGRDMLLRSTLNLLYERELKQGGRIVRGRVECAVMTSNRYLAEVLEESRERLLAFVDRVAYVAFVPRGFASPEALPRVLAAQAGAARPLAPSALLTVQDLDVLQDAADAVIVPDEMFHRLTTLLRWVEEELAAAMRADPTFVPTRYLSTRTAVRLARALKAAVVRDRAMRGERALEVGAEDFEALRLALLLSGPSPDQVATLLAAETDPRERRQLAILRTEREIFDRCLTRLPAARPVRRGASEPSAPAIEVREGAPLEALASLAEHTDDRVARSAETRLASEVDALVRGATEAALLGAIAPAESDAGELREVDPIAVAERLGALADQLDAKGGTRGRPVSRWLRGRALSLLAEIAGRSPSRVGEALMLAGSDDGHVEHARTVADLRLARLTRLVQLRDRLRAAGADEEAGAIDAAFARALERVTEDVALAWDAGFASAAERALAHRGALSGLLAVLAPALAHVAHADATLERLGSAPRAITSRVVGPRIAPLVEQAYARFEARDRRAVGGEVDALLAQLEAAGLAGVVPVSAQLGWAIEALLRCEGTPIDAPSADHEGYRALRRSDHRVSIVYAAALVHARLSGASEATTPEPAEALIGLRDRLHGLPEELIARMVEADFARLDRALDALSRWWDAIASSSQSDDAGAALLALSGSRFFEVVHDEAALVRFALEASLIAELVPSARPRAEALRARIERLDDESRRVLVALAERRATARWSALLPRR